MPDPSTLPGSNVFPCLRYKDAPAAIEWLVRAFGFEKQMVLANPDGTIAHAQLKMGPGIVMLASAREDRFGMKTPSELGGVTQSIYVALDEVDSHYQRARGAGAEIVMEIQDMDYGSRDYSARDLEGNLWQFGTYRPDAEPGQGG
jgi:uncharacterized glyoxalase superfamily protein PhnB